MKFSTRAIHDGSEPDPITGAIMTPVYLSSTYVQEAPAQHKGYEYSRTGNPTRAALEGCLASLEGGVGACGFASGMSAIDAVVRLLSAGDHVVCGNDLYGGTHRLFTQVYTRFGLSFDFVDASDMQAVSAALRPETRMLWLESPSNPLLQVTDIAAASQLVADLDVLVVVDNTFATPYLQQPLDHGAHVVVHSTTKYLGGHSDVVGGAVVAGSEELLEKIAFLQNSAGAVPGALDSFLTHRGVKTLAVRMERHCDNAQRVVDLLAGHSKVERVHFPGHRSHPGYEVASRQMRRPGGMVAFELQGDEAAAARFASSTKVFSLAESLGGVESLVELPASMTHAAIPREERLKAGLADGLVRLSVGLEDEEDLLEDLQRGLDAV